MWGLAVCESGMMGGVGCRRLLGGDARDLDGGRMGDGSHTRYSMRMEII